MLEVNSQITIPDDELELSYSRSSGPGGQNVNKVNTKVTLHWGVIASPSLPDGVKERFTHKYARRINAEGQLVVTSQRYRDQGRNVADCREKLRAMILEVATPPKKRKKTRPSRASKERRLKEKRAKSDKKSLRRARPGD